MTIDALMENARCTVWPERWRKVYDRAMARFEKEGCIYATGKYYDDLEAKYHMLGPELDTLKRGAAAVSQNEHLLRLLALITDAMTDHEMVYDDIAAFQPPEAPEGEDPFPYDILIGLATFSRVDYTYHKLLGRGVPMEMIQTVLGYYPSGLRAFRTYNGGRDGYTQYLWQQKIADGHVLPIGRFNIEIAAKMNGKAQIFKNEKGEEIALAHDITLHKSGAPLGSKYFEEEEGSFTAQVEETKDGYCGYPYKANGFVSTEKITLSKSEWKKVLAFGDEVIALHIPRNQKFTPDIVDASLKEAVAFLKEHFPEEKCEVFRCYSWMCDPQLLELLPETSNIASFCKRFKALAAPSQGRDVLKYVFYIDEENPDYDALPENTSLLKALKEHYKSGKAIYEMIGYFFA